jgi:glyoxylase-like metal-dependent hydrolase (beta-lactamase superfamily II)
MAKRTFKDKMTIGKGADQIDLYYFGRGHTNGDAWVVFPALRVMHAGDMLAAKQPASIDFDNGGSGLAFPDTLTRAAASVKNVDTVVPGHGPLMTMKDLEEFAQFNRDFRNFVVSGYHHGLSVSEVAQERKPSERFRDYAAPADRIKGNVGAIFSELTKPPPA